MYFFFLSDNISYACVISLNLDSKSSEFDLDFILSGCYLIEFFLYCFLISSCEASSLTSKILYGL